MIIQHVDPALAVFRVNFAQVMQNAINPIDMMGPGRLHRQPAKMNPRPPTVHLFSLSLLQFMQFNTSCVDW